MMCEAWTTDLLRWWGSGAFCVRLRCVFWRQHRLQDVLRTAVSPVNFGNRRLWEVVHARDGDPVSLRMTTVVGVDVTGAGREGGWRETYQPGGSWTLR